MQSNAPWVLLTLLTAAAAAAAGFVNTGAAFLIGVIGSVVCSGAQELMERYGKKYITDTSEVFVCHGVSEWI
jgi:ammonia channel protein AmtB